MGINLRAILKIITIDIIVICILKLSLVFLWPFLMAFLLAILIEPLNIKIMNLGIKRDFAVAISLFLLIFIIIILMFVFVRYITTELYGIYIQIPYSFNIEKYTQIIDKISNLKDIYRQIFNTTVVTINEFINIFIVLILIVFISIDLDKIMSSLYKNIDNKYIVLFLNSFVKLTEIIIIEIKLVIIITLLTIIGLYVLNIENALTIGIICGILDLLPVVGPTLIFLPWSIYELFNKNYFIAIGLISLYLLLQIVREIMQVKMVGNSLKIHPAISLFCFYVGILFFGLWGIIFGPFIIIFTKEIIDLERRIL